MLQKTTADWLNNDIEYIKREMNDNSRFFPPIGSPMHVDRVYTEDLLPYGKHTYLNNILNDDVSQPPTSRLEQELIMQIKAIKSMARRSFFQPILDKVTDFK